MLKSILKINGISQLKKEEQKTIFGGDTPGDTGCPNNPRGMCPNGTSFNCETCQCEPNLG